MPKEEHQNAGNGTENDPISQEMRKMFEGYQVDQLQEVFGADRVANYLLDKIESGKLSPDMPLGEALEKLAEIIRENIGENDDEKNEE